jgi:hypothetical protein
MTTTDEILKQGIEAAKRALPIVREEANRAAHIESQEYNDDVCGAADALEKFIDALNPKL